MLLVPIIGMAERTAEKMVLLVRDGWDGDLALTVGLMWVVDALLISLALGPIARRDN